MVGPLFKVVLYSECPGVVDDGNRVVQPIPMPGTLPYAYMDACKEVSWSAECTTCQKTVASRAQAQPHIAEEHTVIAYCEQTPVNPPVSNHLICI